MKTDDPKLTAYALGELEPSERAALEHLVSEDGEMRSEVEATRAFAAQLRKELQLEDSAPLTESQRARVLQAAEARVEPVVVTDNVTRISRWGGWFLRAAACLAALGVAVGVFFPQLNSSNQAARRSARSTAGDDVMAAAAASSSEALSSAPEEPQPTAPSAPAETIPALRQPLAPMPTARSTPAQNEGATVNEVRARVEDEVARRESIASASTAAKDMKLLTPGLASSASHPAPAAPAMRAETVRRLMAQRLSRLEDEAKTKTEPAAQTAATKNDALALAEVDANGPEARGGSARVRAYTMDKSVPEQQLALRSVRDGDGYVAPRPDQPRELLLLQKQQTVGNTEAYDAISDNPFLDVRGNPLSTFSIDVDSASYANVRRFLNAGQRPPKGAVRIEELINYFSYDYPQPEAGQAFSATLEAATCPWNTEHRLVRVGIKGREIKRDQRPASNLVFLIDVSGSMQPENKLPLVKDSLRLLVDQLGGEDTVAIAVYAGASGCVLEPTRDKGAMRAAIDRLEAGGSTNGASGIQLAYELAQRAFIKSGVNRVILATDGDFNVGVTSQSALIELIEEKAKSGVFLTVLGFGIGNLKDSTLEKLADKGNGNYAYIDTLNEGRRVLVEQMSGTLVTIAKDVKIQVEFNPAQVTTYRLIGYENRLLRKEDFNDDTKDAGEIGAGHSVTALYEIVPIGKQVAAPAVDGLRYQQPEGDVAKRVETARSKELLTLKLRHKDPDGAKSQLMEIPLTDQGLTWEKSSRDFRFAAAVASFGMLLRDSPHKGNANWESTLELAVEGKNEDPSGYRAEFISLIGKAKSVAGQSVDPR